MRTVPSLSLMPPAFVTSSTQSWMPSVCRFEVTFWLPVWDWVNPIVNVFVCVAGALLAVCVGVVPPHAAATSPATASAAPARRMPLMCPSLAFVRRDCPLLGTAAEASRFWPVSARGRHRAGAAHTLERVVGHDGRGEPGEGGDDRGGEVGPRKDRVEEKRDEAEVAEAVEELPGREAHPAAEPRRDEGDDEQIERDRAEPDREPAVARDERHEDVEDADARGGVEDERDDVCEDERDDEPGRPIVERAQGAVLREEGERRGPRGEPAARRDAERGVRAEAARPRELPEEEVHLGAGGLRDGGAGRGRHGRAHCDRGPRARRDRDDGGLERRVRDRKMVRGVVERTAEDGEREERAPELERPGGSPPGRLAALRSGLGGALLAGRDGALRRVQVSLLLCLSHRDTRRERAAHENKVRTHEKALSRADFLARS